MATAKDFLVSDIGVRFFVRRSLNDDRVVELAILLEAGTVLPPILIDQDKQVIDGRHRLEAYKMANKTHISCEVVRNLSPAEQILTALKCNMGGSLPPTRADIRLAIQNMITAGMKAKTVIDSLPLPASVTRRYIQEATSTLAKSKVRSAVEAVVDSEMRIPDAAAKFGIDVDELRTAIRGKKKESATNSFGLPKIKAAVSARYRGSSQQNAHMFQKLLDDYIDGDCSYKLVEQALDLTAKAIDSQAQNVSSWRLRLDAAKRNQETV